MQKYSAQGRVFLHLAPAPGFEPGTHALTERRSTVELCRNIQLLIIFSLAKILKQAIVKKSWSRNETGLPTPRGQEPLIRAVKENPPDSLLCFPLAIS